MWTSKSKETVLSPSVRRNYGLRSDRGDMQRLHPAVDAVSHSTIEPSVPDAQRPLRPLLSGHSPFSRLRLPRKLRLRVERRGKGVVPGVAVVVEHDDLVVRDVGRGEAGVELPGRVRVVRLVEAKQESTARSSEAETMNAGL